MYWQAQETIRRGDNLAPGPPEISPRCLTSPEGVRDRSWRQNGGPGRGTAAPGRGAGGRGVRAVSLAGRDRRPFGDEDSGPCLVRRGRARSSFSARRWTSLGIRCRAGRRGEPGRLHDEVHVSRPVAPVVQAPRSTCPALAAVEWREDKCLPDGSGRRRRPRVPDHSPPGSGSLNASGQASDRVEGSLR